jgi:hypothetical protein
MAHGGDSIEQEFVTHMWSIFRGAGRYLPVIHTIFHPSLFSISQTLFPLNVTLAIILPPVSRETWSLNSFIIRAVYTEWFTHRMLSLAWSCGDEVPVELVLSEVSRLSIIVQLFFISVASIRCIWTGCSKCVKGAACTSQNRKCSCCQKRSSPVLVYEGARN